MQSLDFLYGPFVNIPANKLDHAYQQLFLNCSICSIAKKSSLNKSQDIINARCDRCILKMTALERYARSNIPVEFWELGMDSFRGPDLLKRIYQNTIDNFPVVYNEGKSFLLSGPHGLGKSLSAANILKQASLKNYRCLYTTLTDLVNIIVEAPYEQKFQAKKEMLTTDFFVLDEIDPRFINAGNMELFGKTLENVLRTRLSNKLPNIFITNSPNMLETFQGEIGESLKSLFSRVKEFSFIGQDFRKQLKV